MEIGFLIMRIQGFLKQTYVTGGYETSTALDSASLIKFEDPLTLSLSHNC